MSGKRTFWSRDARRDRKEKRLRAKLAKVEQECKALEEENRFCGTVLARMRLHARAEVAELQRRLEKLGVGPEQEKPRND